MTDATGVPLDGRVLELLQGRAVCHIATLMPDGSPQLTLTWVGTDGVHVIVNTVVGTQKVRNAERDPRVAIDLSAEDEPWRYVRIRGRVVEITTDGAEQGIQDFSQRYTGHAYRGYGPNAGKPRVILKVLPERITGSAG